jgi:hypothetical protein
MLLSQLHTKQWQGTYKLQLFFATEQEGVDEQVVHPLHVNFSNVVV